MNIVGCGIGRKDKVDTGLAGARVKLIDACCTVGIAVNTVENVPNPTVKSLVGAVPIANPCRMYPNVIV